MCIGKHVGMLSGFCVYFDLQPSEGWHANFCQRLEDAVSIFLPSWVGALHRALMDKKLECGERPVETPDLLLR